MKLNIIHPGDPEPGEQQARAGIIREGLTILATHKKWWLLPILILLCLLALFVAVSDEPPFILAIYAH